MPSDAELREGKRELLSLMDSIWRAEYLREAPNWKPLDYLAGMVSQIDNMYAGVRSQRDEARFKIPALLTRIEVLEKALRPFAEAGDYIKIETIGYEPSDELWLMVADPGHKMHGLLKVQFGAFYDARTAIEGGKP